MWSAFVPLCRGSLIELQQLSRRRYFHICTISVENLKYRQVGITYIARRCLFIARSTSSSECAFYSLRSRQILLLEIYTNIVSNFHDIFVTLAAVSFPYFMRWASLSCLNYASRCHGLRLSVLNKETSYLLNYFLKLLRRLAAKYSCIGEMKCCIPSIGPSVCLCVRP